MTIARRAFGQLRLTAVVWAFVFGGTVAASALSYVSSFPTAASREQVAATTQGDTGLRVLFGPISAIDTVGGYTVYKCFVFLTTFGAVWALLAATRLLRLEEDTGRWQLVLAGRTRAPRATIATLTGLGAAIAVVFAGTAALTLLAARDDRVHFGTGESMLYALSIVVAPAVFAAVGALTSQLGRTRRVATGLGMAALGAAFLVRMVADSAASNRWLLWATPFGWTELMRPFTENNAWPLVPAAASVVVLAGGAAWLSSRRDVGAGLLAGRDSAPARRVGLRSPARLVTRLELPVLTAWCVGAAMTGFAFGIVVKVATGQLPDSLRDTLTKFGVRGTFANQYFGVGFLIVAAVVAMLPAGQVGGTADEETSGRLVHVLVQPVRRATVFASRLALAAVAVVLAGLFSGVGAWLGAKSQGYDAGIARMAGAGLNVVPSALVALGIGAVLLAVAPRRAAAAVYVVVVASLVFDLLGSMVENLRWTEHLSLFHYMALAPAQDVAGSTVAVTLAVAIVLCGAATLLFRTRDLQSTG
jgi:ABC-2 type transport system permease protein